MLKPIDTPEALRDSVAELQGRSVFFLDTEFDSAHGGPSLCLLQLSDGQKTYLFDPLALSLAPLAELLGAPGVEWVLHSGRQDVPLLCRLLNVSTPERVFDTQVAWALVSPEAGVALAYLEFVLLGVQPAKGHQIDDWRRRPLPPHLLAYAARDVAQLPALREQLSARLDAAGRLFAVYPASREAVDPPPEPPSPLTLASFRNAWQLDRPAQAAMQALITWANTLSQEEARDLPDSKILLSLASRRPATVDELGQMRGVPRRLTARRGAELVTRLRDAAERASDADFVPMKPPPYATHDEIWARARLELVRAQACRLLDAAPEVLMPARLLDRLRPRLAATGDLASLLDRIEGFRHALLAPVWSEAIRLDGPPPAGQ